MAFERKSKKRRARSRSKCSTGETFACRPYCIERGRSPLNFCTWPYYENFLSFSHERPRQLRGSGCLDGRILRFIFCVATENGATFARNFASITLFIHLFLPVRFLLSKYISFERILKINFLPS